MRDKETAPAEHAAYKAMVLTSYRLVRRKYSRMAEQIHPDWLASFKTFYRDMGERPSGATLTRIDPNKRWQKDNCAWV